MNLSSRIRAVSTSGTAAMLGVMEKMTRAGRPVINLAIGEPDFDPPLNIITATRDALSNGKTRYTETTGIMELKENLAAGMDGCEPGNIIITNGAKQALYSVFQVLLNPADEVILPSPYWVSFGHQIKLASATPVVVPTVNHQLDMPAIEAALTPKTKAILINSPNNPTGAVYPEETLGKVADLADAHDLMIVSDETYDTFIYNGAAGAACKWPFAANRRLIHIRSFSKQFAMTGFRVGFAVGPVEVISAMASLQSHSTGNVCTFAQYGALAALSIPGATEDGRYRLLMRKRDIAFSWASEMFKCIRPDGAFYIFPDVRGHLAQGQSSMTFAEGLLNRAGVAVVPGEEFGAPGHIRICFAVPEKLLLDGLQKIKEAL